MSLIDLNSLFSNLIWILGLAWLLSVLSMARWRANQRGRNLREQLSKPGEQNRLMVGALILSVGLGLVAESTWQVVTWFVLAFLFIFLILISARTPNG